MSGCLLRGAVLLCRRRRLAELDQELHAQQNAELTSCGLPESFIDTHLEQLRALRVDRLDADLPSLLDPDGMHAVVIGRFDVDKYPLGQGPQGRRDARTVGRGFRLAGNVVGC